MRMMKKIRVHCLDDLFQTVNSHCSGISVVGTISQVSWAYSDVGSYSSPDSDQR